MQLLSYSWELEKQQLLTLNSIIRTKDSPKIQAKQMQNGQRNLNIWTLTLHCNGSGAVLRAATE